MSQYALAEKLGITQGSISAFASGKKNPGPATCLALAGVCPSEDLAYWIEQSGLSREAIATISKALKIEVQQERISGVERDVLAWWQQPADAMGRNLQEAVRTWLASRPTEISHEVTAKSVPLVPEITRHRQDYAESPHQRWHLLLDLILDSGSDVFVRGIKANLESWGEVAAEKSGRSSQRGDDAAPLSPNIAAKIAGARSRIKQSKRDETGGEKGGKRTA